MGFRKDIEKVIGFTPDDRQTILFSATMTPDVLEFSKTYLKDPVNIKIKADELTVKNIEQYYIDIPRNAKTAVLDYLITEYKPTRSLIFCNTKRQVDKLLIQLRGKNYMADGLHGDMAQNTRTKVMTKFKKGELSILIATDVAARGIDVKDIDIVFNYDIPKDMDFYVHRIGRTARAGKTGRAITLSVGDEQLHSIFALERFTNSKIERMDILGLSVEASSHSDSAPAKQKRKNKGSDRNHGRNAERNPARNSERNKEKAQEKTPERSSGRTQEKSFERNQTRDAQPKSAQAILSEARKKGLEMPRNTAAKISLDEYFQKMEETGEQEDKQKNKMSDKPLSTQPNRQKNRQPNRQFNKQPGKPQNRQFGKQPNKQLNRQRDNQSDGYDDKQNNNMSDKQLPKQFEKSGVQGRNIPSKNNSIYKTNSRSKYNGFAGKH